MYPFLDATPAPTARVQKSPPFLIARGSAPFIPPASISLRLEPATKKGIPADLKIAAFASRFPEPSLFSARVPSWKTLLRSRQQPSFLRLLFYSLPLSSRCCLLTSAYRSVPLHAPRFFPNEVPPTPGLWSRSASRTPMIVAGAKSSSAPGSPSGDFLSFELKDASISLVS